MSDSDVRGIYERSGTLIPPRVPVKSIIDDTITTSEAFTIPAGAQLMEVAITSDADVFFAWGDTCTAANDGFDRFFKKDSVYTFPVPYKNEAGNPQAPTQFALLSASGTAKVRIVIW